MPPADGGFNEGVPSVSPATLICYNPALCFTSPQAKEQAIAVGVASPLASVLAANLEEGHLLEVRAHMLVTDLLQVDNLQVCAAAAQLCLRFAGWVACQ